MSRLLAAIMILLASLTLAAPLRVALLGEPSELLDLLTAELSSNPALELLARTEIEQVLREHQLTATDIGQLVKLFPHTDIFATFTQAWDKKSGRMLLFNAKNSYRLADVPWTGEAAVMATRYAKAISKSLGKLQIKTPLCLSIAIMRNVAINLSQRSALDDWGIQFERGLLEHAEIQLLERERLGMVSDERSLTSQTFALTTSARVLMLEFETGENATVINLKLLCSDLGGRELLRLACPDILKDPQDSITRLVGELVSGLLALPDTSPIATEAQAEAQKLYQTYKNTLSPEKALQKIQAAVALAPGNETYRHATVSAYAFKLYQVDSLECLREAKKLLAMIRKFQSDFPQTTLPYLPAEALHHFFLLGFSNTSQLEQYRVRYNTEKVQLLEQLAQGIEEFYAEIRPLARQDLLRDPNYTFDWADGLSAKELQNYQRYLQKFYFSHRLYINLDTWLHDYFSDYQQLLQQMEQENLRRPYLNKKYHEQFLPYHNLFRDGDVAFRRFLEHDKTFIAYLETSTLPFGKANALEMRTVLELLKNIPHADKMPAIFRSFFSALEDISPGCFTDYKTWKRILSEGCFSIICEQYYNLPRNQAASYLDQYLGRAKIYLEELLNNASRGNGNDHAIETLLQQIPQIQALNFRYLTEYKICNALRELAFVVWEQAFFANQGGHSQYVHKLTAKQEELLLAINNPLGLEFARFDETLQNDSPLVCCHACQDGEDVLLFLGQNGSYPKPAKTFLVSIAPDGKMRKLPYSVPFDERAVFYGEIDCYKRYGMTCNQQYIILCNHWELVVIERASGQARKLQHSVHTLAGLTLQDDRIYILGNGIFESMNCRGEKRKIHFSQQRIDKLNALDRGGKAHDLTVLGNGRLLFKVAHKLPKSAYSKEEIWLYDSGADCLISVLELPAQKNYSLTSVKNIPYLVAAEKQRSVIYRLDSTDWRLQVLAQPPAKNKWSNAVHHLNGSDTNGPIAYPYILADDFLWCGGLYPACVNLSEPEKSALLWLPTCQAVFKLADKILFLRHNYWFTVQSKKTLALNKNTE